MATPFINSSLEDVKFHLENQSFEGPIDLLVSMVKESKIDIMEIFVSDITSQYIFYVKTLKELDYEYVSQYIILAATLIEIKSSKLLPIQEEYEEYQEEVSQMERQLISDVEKRLLLEFPEKLRPRETLNLFYPEPEYNENDYKLIAKNLTLDQLLGAYQLILEKAVLEESAKTPKTITMERFTVSEQVKNIAYKVRTQKEIKFYDLFEKDYTRSEIINVFLAILEVVKKQIALAQQSDTNDILLIHNADDIFDIANYNEEELTKMLKNMIEGLIFAAAKGVNYDTMKNSFGTEYTEKELKQAINELKTEYDGEKGIVLIEFNKTYQFQTNPIYGEVLADILRPIRERQLSATVLQTLSIIAYRQPITRAEIEEVRSGVSSDYAIGILMKSELIEPVGRKNTIGKPVLFATTDNFLKRFRLNALTDLPDYDKLIEHIKASDKFNKDSENLYGIEQGVFIEDALTSDSEDNFVDFNDEETPDFLKDEDIVII